MEGPWIHTYRVRPYLRNLGIVFACFCMVIGTLSTTAALLNAGGSFRDPMLSALGFAVFWLIFSFVGFALLAHHHWYRLCANEDSLLQITLFKRRKIRLADVRELKWRCFPKGGSVQLCDTIGRLRLDPAKLVKQRRAAHRFL